MTQRQLKDLNFFAWIFLAVVFIMVRQAWLDRTIQRDFTYFYSVGQILNHYPPDHLYQISLQEKIFNEVLPIKHGRYGPSPYPPYVAMLFRPFSLLPFWTAYKIWMLVSLGLYLTGMLMLVRRFFGGEGLRQSLLCCFGLSLWPFLGRTLLNGQLSSVGFFAIALAICLEDADRPLLSGLSLSACIYKPTLLLLIVPMLVFTRRFKSSAGLAIGATILVALTTLIEGAGIWPAYIQMSIDFSHLKAIITSNYVDLFASSRDFRQAWPLFSWGIFALFAIVSSLLIRLWWLGAYTSRTVPANLVWGCTITWTLILNIYVPIYDTILVVVSIIITAAAFSKDSRRAFIGICVTILISSYVTVQIAAATGVQILTVLLVALGALQMRLCFRSLNRHTSLTEARARSPRALPGGIVHVASAAEEGCH